MTTRTFRDTKQDLSRIGRQAKHATSNPWVESVERLGYLVRGLLYFIIGVLALQLALGAGGATADQTGAIAMIGSQPMGKALLIVTTVGLAGYSFWGFVRAFGDPLRRGTSLKGIVERIGFLISGLSYGILVIPTADFVLNRPVGGASAGKPADLTAQLLSQPNGRWLVFAFALFWGAAAVGQFYSAYTAHFARDFQTSTMSKEEFKLSKEIGRLGYAARGVVFGLSGWFIFESALTLDPRRAVGFDGVLLKLAQAPYGPLVLAVVAFGLVAFGVFSALCAKWIKVD